ncbi:DUF4145 domain-containing protein [Deinococcus aquiradiocola]|uniref:DUF4145 domain-containing protein n=1 Tax=Deinococcus aquiradiocola TaxID=393059 RepID=A0A917PQX5_9DEIO|nr:DUF4145 domain-containing protein [Deinococcus aquiradiocola]GGJ88713.1 hypothetical protein GCM10008939_36010 [Deinococcus aquiradiocola]
MRSVPLHSIVAWNDDSTPARPLRLNSTCGVCNKDLSIDVSGGHYHEEDTWLAVVRCPNPTCHAVLRYLGFDLDGPRFTRLYVHPSYADARQPMKDYEMAPERIQKAYVDTLSTLNGGIPSAVATLARKTLEGIIRHAYPNPEGIRDRSLSKLIRDLPQSRDLGRPILELGQTMREGGSLNAHFDLDRDTDAQTAERMVELLENLIEYLYVIPGRMATLRKDFD